MLPDAIWQPRLGGHQTHGANAGVSPVSSVDRLPHAVAPAIAAAVQVMLALVCVELVAGALVADKAGVADAVGVAPYDGPVPGRV